MTPTALQQIELPHGSSPAIAQIRSPELVMDPMLDRFDLLYLVKKYWKRLLLLPMLGGAIALGVAMMKQPLFESSAVILVDPSYDMIIQIEEVADGHRSDLEALKSLEVAILADWVLLRVLERLDLRSAENFLPDDLSGPEVSDLKILHFLRENRVKAMLVPQTRLIKISVLDPEPERAQQIADALSSEFESYLGEQRGMEVDRVRNSLEAQAEKAREAAVKSEKRLEEFREEHPRFPVEQDHSLYGSRLSQFGEQLNTASGLRMQLESKKKALESLDPETSPIEIIDVAEYREMSHVSILLDTLAAARSNLSVLESQYQADHPALRKARAQAEQNEAELRKLAGNIKAAVTANYAAEKSREDMLTKEVGVATVDFMEMKAVSSEFRALQQQAERDWSAHQALQTKLSEIDVSTELASQIATKVSEPMVPYKKAKPSLLLHLVIGGMGGGFLAGGALLVAVLSGLPFSNSRQLEQRLGLPVIADWSESKKRPAHSAHSTALLQYLGGNRDKLIQISAPQLNGIGESVAHRVAVMAAQNGRRTLLILIKAGDADSEIRPSQIDNLFLLEVPPGVVQDSERFTAGLEQLKNSFDNVFVEAGAADDLELVDLLSSYADQDVVVVGKGMTSKQFIDERVARLSRPGAAPVALIMVGAE